MKVLLESSTFYPSPPAAYAGTEQIVYLLAEELHRLGHQVAVVAPIGSKFSEGIEHIASVPPEIGAHKEDVVWPMYLPRLVDMKTGKPTGEFDVVHTHSFRMWPYMAAKDHPSIKVCATVHWQMHWPQVGAALPPVPKPNLIGLSAAHSMAVSAALGTHVEYVHNGVRPQDYTFKKEKGDRYLFLGRIARFKGPHEAIALATEGRFPLDVAGEDRFVGDVPYVHQVMNACRDMATYHGEVTTEKKRQLLADAKAVLCPYMWAEPFGLVPIEANASGTPAVGLDFPGSAMREIIEDGVNGFLCRDIKEMGEAAKNVGDIKPRDCLQVVQEKFTAKRMATEYAALYERVVKEGGGW